MQETIDNEILGGALALPVPTLKITAGSVEHNLPKLLEAIKKRLESYRNIVYGENAISVAKRDRADLNALAKAVNEARLKAEKEFMKPFYEIKDICKEIDTEIKSAAAMADNFIKTAEEKMREDKRRECELIFANEEFNLVDFEQIFNEKWLNKSVSLIEVKKEINERISKIQNDIEVIEALPGCAENNLKAFYLGSLDISQTLAHGKSLTERKERLAMEEAEREAKLEAEAEINAKLVASSKMGVILDTPIEVKAMPQFDEMDAPAEIPQQESDDSAFDWFPNNKEFTAMMTKTITVTLTETKYVLLIDFLKLNQIEFKENN